MIVHVGDERGLDHLVAGGASGVPAPARRLARACWPGPLTVVVRRSAAVPDEVTGGRDTRAQKGFVNPPEDWYDLSTVSVE